MPEASDDELVSDDDVADDEEGDHAASPEVDADDGAADDAVAEAAAQPAVDDDPASDWDAEHDDQGESEDRAASRARLVLVGLGILLVGLLIGRLTAPDGGSSESADSGASPAADEEIPFPAGDVNRTGYWGFVGLEALVVDTFDRPDDAVSLGETGTDQAWQADSGQWGIEGNSAVRTSGAAGAQSIAVVPVGQGDGLVEVTATVVEQGAGMVFRYLDATNYWTITANPALGSWVVNRIIDGQPELVGELAAPTSDGVTITVTENESLLRFLIDGVEYLRVTDSTFGGQLQAGLVSSAESTGDARWDRFLTMTTVVGDGADAEADTSAPPTTTG